MAGIKHHKQVNPFFTNGHEVLFPQEEISFCYFCGKELILENNMSSSLDDSLNAQKMKAHKECLQKFYEEQRRNT